MERIERDDILLGVAQLVSLRGTCERLHVGAVIANSGIILASGYNGSARGLVHCGHNCNLELPCSWAIHAEINAIIHAARIGVSVVGATLYTTDSPCESCAKAIINSGIESVVFLRKYRDEAGLRLLTGGHVQWRHYYIDPVDMQKMSDALLVR